MPQISLRDRAREMADTARDMCSRVARLVRTARTQGLTPRQRRVVLYGIACIVVGAGMCALMAWLIASIVGDPTGFEALVAKNYPLACVAYALVNTVQVFFGFVPGEPLEILAGYLFGMWGGLAVVRAGLALGEALVFCAVRRWGPRFVHLFVSQEKLDELSFFRDVRRLNVVAFLMMLIPGTPKAILIYLVGLTPMHLSTWMAIAVPARCVSILASTAVGAQVAEDNWLLAVGIFAVSAVLSLAGVAYYLVVERQARRAAVLDELGRREWEAAGRRSNDAVEAVG